MQSGLTLDNRILIYIQEHIRCSFLSPIMIFITHLGDAGAIWIAYIIGLMHKSETKSVGFMAILALLASALINNLILKNLTKRKRPFDLGIGITSLIKHPKDYSFPSGHTGSSIAVATIILLNLSLGLSLPALIIALLIGFSRLYIGVHYPSDVLFGAFTGILIGFIINICI